MRTILESSSRGGGEFLSLYYQYADGDRSQLRQLYSPSGSSCVYLGNAFDGAEAVLQHKSSLPRTTHVLRVSDAQPVEADEQTGLPRVIAVTAQGTVKYGNAERKEFSQMFVLEKTDKHFFITRDVFRFSK